MKTDLELLCKTEPLTDEDSDTLTIRGVASNLNKDLQGETVTLTALKSMRDQAVGLNLHLEHRHDIDNAIGIIKNSYINDNELYIEADILPQYSDDIRSRLEFGQNMGLSIGGKAVFASDNKTINDFKLLEISLVGIPANYDSFSTVEVVKGIVKCKCLTAGLTKLEEINNMNNIEETTENVEEIIKAQNIESETTDDPVVEEVKADVNEEETVEYVTKNEIGELLNAFFVEKEQQLTANITDAVTKAIEDSIQKQAQVKASETLNAEAVEETEATTVEEETKDVEVEDTKTADAELKTIEKVESKFDSYEAATEKAVEFLGSEERDMFGRNLKYL